MMHHYVRLYDIMKRAFDIVLAVISMLLLFPIIIGVIILIYFRLDKRVFFIQTRVGKNHKLFKIYKFKTMNDHRDSCGNLLADELRITKFGKLIRSLSLDELPQLWNVLIGDLSFVGPRPLLVEYIPLYSLEQDRRHEVKPGITGWAQINGRNSISWTQKFNYDIWYVDNRSLWLDIKIICLTFAKVIKRHGVSQSNLVTMERFSGNQ